MNVLILTPDAVGSTLLQRLTTVYMQFHQYDKPVINLHELTNGLAKYYSSDFNQEVLGKKADKWGYYQSLQEIVELLESVDHYKTSRLAQYHIRRRNDAISDQIPFYNYLNENFFVIACRRKNVFEHALSWSLNKITKKLNVYSGEEKLDTFINMYAQPIEINTDALIKSVEEYKDYLDWSNNYFSVGSYFEYDQDLENIESYILNLPVFAAQKEKISWKKTFGIEFNDWNRCHYLSSDVGSLALDHKERFNLLLSAPESKSRDLQVVNRNLLDLLPTEHKTFLKDNLKAFVDAKQCVNRMIELGIMVNSIPIKKQTLREKMHIIKNLDECIDVYNLFIEQNPGIGNTVNKEELMEAANVEQTRWLPRISQSATTAQSAQQNSGLLLSQNDGSHGHNPTD
jgi:hypothetical protein